MKRIPIRALALLLAVLPAFLAGCSSAVATDTTVGRSLIPRQVLFGNPDRVNVQISPDGKHISFLAPSEGVLNVWVAPVHHPEAAKAITRDRTRGVREYFWAYTNDAILYIQDKGGDENWHVYRADLAGGEAQDLTPVTGAQAQIQEVSHKFPEVILVGLNDRDQRFHDIYCVNIRTGERKLMLQSPGTINEETVMAALTDEDYDLRFVITTTGEGGMRYHRVHSVESDGKSASLEPVAEIGMEDAMTTSPRGWDKTGRTLFVADSRDRDTAALYAIDVDSGTKELLAEDPHADAGDVLQHPTENNVQAVAFEYDRRAWKVLDPAVQADFDYLKTVADGDFEVTGRTLADDKWTVAYLMDDGPVRFYLYDRTAKKATFLFTNRKALEGLPLVKMHPVVIRSRDGLNLVSYLSLPRGQAAGTAADSRGAAVPKPARPVPMVLLVHGGPWARDSWGLSTLSQWLANRGYAVLSVNYRGSTGFGKSFVNASNREWATKMHDDLLDAVNWTVASGIADKSKIAIMGGSYGGYATLVGLTFTPDVFACGVDIVGPSRLVTLLETIPPYWAPALTMFKARVGDHTTPEGRAFLDSRSPLAKVDQIKRPLLIGQGANDPRVKQSESDQIVQAMRQKNLPVIYVLYPDEGHGFVRPENRLSFNAVTEQFLASHLGGSAEPIGDDLEGSSITVPHGADHVRGLPALPAKRP